jgi:glycosyltransferase involved in cell wall biosynthesis
LRALYVHHTALISGAERSLLGLFSGLPPGSAPLLACPRGPLASAAAAGGARVASIPALVASFKLHPLHTPAAAARLAAGAAVLTARAGRSHVDLLHANSVRAALIAIPAAAVLRRPLVVHVRDVLPPSGAANAIRRVVLARADAIIAISRHVASAFDPEGRARLMRVVDNPLDTGRLDPALLSQEEARRRLGIDGDGPLLGIVGQITKWKAQDDAIRVLAHVRREHPGAQLLVVGETKFVARATRYDNPAFLRGLHALITELGLEGAVHFLGEREDVAEILRALDLALVPSWEEPFGRTVVEAMAMGLPVIATDVGGPPEVITDGEDGVLLPPQAPDRWGATAAALLADPARRARMGALARERVLGRFGLGRHVEAVFDVYRELRPTP